MRVNRFSIAETARLAERRRPFDRLESRIVRKWLANPEMATREQLEQLRYVLSFAKLTQVRNVDGVDVDVGGINALHALHIQEVVEQRWADGGIPSVLKSLDNLVIRTARARRAALDHLPLDRDSLEAEVTTRVLAVASGGGGGAGYVYPGVYESLERNGMQPSLMTGTSIGSLMAMFRCRFARYDPAPMIAAARSLAWSKVFRVMEANSRYGLPATLRLYLQHALGHLFRHPEGRALRLSDLGIPLYVVATGITVDALKHDVDYYEHFIDRDLSRASGFSVRSAIKTIGILREFLSQRDALRTVALGRAEGTQDFDVLDAAGFSAAIPGVIHYDVIRDDPRMHRILDNLYSDFGISRLGEGGMVSNVPARIAWESVVSGDVGRRNVLVLALDCFAPNRRTLAWLPLQQLVRSANVEADRKFADCYLTFKRVPSPVNLVPTLKGVFQAMRWGRESVAPKLPYLKEMMRPIGVIPELAPPK
ncbi:MAG: putative acylesterase/phospholipase RssA [Myxococcota bacterium]